MVLQDHFHPPLSVWRHWHAFHNGWAYNIAEELNQQLPQYWFAEPNVQFGIEIDVATFESQSADASAKLQALTGSRYTPPAPNHTMAFDPTLETVEISIYNSTAGPVLVGAIELVSPANKDRSSHREAFLAKCETCLREGIGLVIVDVVTDRLVNLHNALMEQWQEDFRLSADLYAVAYRLVEAGGQPQLQIWTEELAIGRPLPTLPLWLRGEICLPVNLHSAYEKTCVAQKIRPEDFQPPMQLAG
ncbi:MAG TPA: DUF4058 family protein [Blastocatellia bacterium]|nr:DUF4058 family protein [Blastocatellia bacterium]